MTTGNDYSQPQQFTVDQHGNVYLYENYGNQSGLTKREEFAARAMIGLVSDALIAELNKTT